MTKFLKTKAVLASLAAGALAFGTACKSDSGAARETTDTTDTGTMSDPNTGTTTDTDTTMSPGTGGTGMDDPMLTPETDPMDPNSVDPNADPTMPPGTGGTGTEVDPNLDPDMSSEPGTGGAGDVEPLDTADSDELDVDDDATLEPGTGGSGMTDPDNRLTPPTPLPENSSTR
ncbi:hypothetical protein [Corallococcus macrosporus]|uniref:Lipoprotein n=2 Tax=Myxococcaceae TaxID=31 RepID=A0A250JM01_9BACT|nr:hypothetical protein [Corallococcus macrosporus]AEI63220.1 putative lipoprotein [Corallococcus macrosporus]ATB44895.1 hypothetical protein MYMAC_000478 [Corallococcus macrosporus DSM 14697]